MFHIAIVKVHTQICPSRKYCISIMRHTLKDMGRLNHIKGEVVPPNNPNFQTLDSDDSWIITWILRSVKITCSIPVLKILGRSWNYFITLYISTCYELEGKILGAKQGTFSMVEYYGVLKGV